MMNPASLPHSKLMRATELIGTRVAPVLREVNENYTAGQINCTELSEMPLYSM